MATRPITEADLARELERGFLTAPSLLSQSVIFLGEGAATPRGGDFLVKLPPGAQSNPPRLRPAYDCVTFSIELVCDMCQEAEAFAAINLERLRQKPKLWRRGWRTLWRGFCWRSGWRPELQEREGMKLRAAMVARIGAVVAADFERRIEEGMLGTYGG